MEEIVSKEDLRQFGILLLDNLRTIIQENNLKNKESIKPEWIKSK